VEVAGAGWARFKQSIKDRLVDAALIVAVLVVYWIIHRIFSAETVQPSQQIIGAVATTQPPATPSPGMLEQIKDRGAELLTTVLVIIVVAYFWANYQLAKLKRDEIDALKRKHTPPLGTQAILAELAAEAHQFEFAGRLDAIWLLGIIARGCGWASDVNANQAMIYIAAQKRIALGDQEITYDDWQHGDGNRFHRMFDLLAHMHLVGYMHTDQLAEHNKHNQPSAQRMAVVQPLGIEVWRWSLVWDATPSKGPRPDLPKPPTLPDLSKQDEGGWINITTSSMRVSRRPGASADQGQDRPDNPPSGT
jgi:hypothetical protein